MWIVWQGNLRPHVRVPDGCEGTAKKIGSEPDSVAGQTAPIPRRHAVVAGVDNKMGALLAQIEPDGPAGKAGLLPGDVVIKLDGVDVNGVDDLIRVLDRDRIDRTLAMDVLRMGRLRAVDIHPIERKPAARQGSAP